MRNFPYLYGGFWCLPWSLSHKTGAMSVSVFAEYDNISVMLNNLKLVMQMVTLEIEQYTGLNYVLGYQ